MDNGSMAPVPEEALQGQGQGQGQCQSTLCNLSFRELHNKLGNVGKPLQDTNYNELLKNVMSLEEGNHHLMMQNSSSSSSSSSSTSMILGNFNLNGMSLSKSKKTADEVWKEIVHVNGMTNRFGDATLEELVAHAGVVNSGNQNTSQVLNPHQPAMSIDHMVMVSQQTDWLQFQMAIQQQHHNMMALDSSNFSASEAIYENPVVDAGYPESQLALTTIPMSTTTSSESQAAAAAAEKKRKYSNEIMEKTIERRQKRMIKNRESAARSRARKQAYTNQLEHQVKHLEMMNTWLKRQKEVDKLYLSSDLLPLPKYHLRRTSSAPL